MRMNRVKRKSIFSMSNPLESNEERFSTVRSIVSLNQYHKIDLDWDLRKLKRKEKDIK